MTSTMAGNITDVPFFSDNASLHHYVHAAPPFYFTSRPTIFNRISDETLSLVVPIVAYWGYSLFFQILDSLDWPLLNKYRIHESAEVKTRNRVTKTDVLLAVIFQQVIQTALGIYWMNGDEEVHSCLTDLGSIRNAVIFGARHLLGEPTAVQFLRAYGPVSVWFLYWWAIPLGQLVFAMFCIDTWQYFLHRAMHMNKFLYKHFHSWHHRLYVPYAFGALYNHPVEGFLLDTLGAMIADSLSMMSVRQASVLFAFSTMKTIDDHCGYRLPLDPLQLLFGNNADYHDIHHQIVGIKSNFAQPFFIHWDTILGTRMTRETLEQRKRRTKEKMT
ncbi:fatty acid hydroxylase superfamily-domain-containing protein [Phellopilus nigrolimitatus]|nr:fatty acid hydroxylase superfamily-domain-containing protein [Phellopilus nigrolimitatus]